VIGLQPLEQYGTQSEDLQQDSVDLVDKGISGSSEEPFEDTSLKATSTIIPEISILWRCPTALCSRQVLKGH
jgi:hypothetical protein